MKEFLEIATFLKDPAIILAGIVVFLFYKLMMKKEETLDKMRITLSETVILLNKLFDARRDGRG